MYADGPTIASSTTVTTHFPQHLPVAKRDQRFDQALLDGHRPPAGSEHRPIASTGRDRDFAGERRVPFPDLRLLSVLNGGEMLAQVVLELGNVGYLHDRIIGHVRAGPSGRRVRRGCHRVPARGSESVAATGRRRDAGTVAAAAVSPPSRVRRRLGGDRAHHGDRRRWRSAFPALRRFRPGAVA